MPKVATVLALLALVPLHAQTAPGAQTSGALVQTTGRRVAITIDDAPAVNELSNLPNFQRVVSGLIEGFVAEKVPVTVFVNERQLNVAGQRDARAAALDQWLDAGFDLGNHGYAHVSASNAPLQDFMDDVIKGEVIMRPVLERRGRTLVWFRYPYLHSGSTPETHQAVVDFLGGRGYRIAHVTVDYADYTFAGAYTRELRAGRAEMADRIRQAYIEQTDAGFEHAEKASLELFGYEPPQILLIHCNELNSVALRDSISRIRARGYAFIGLDEAVADPVYARPDTFTGPGGSWLSRTAAALGRKIETTRPPVVPAWITGQGQNEK